MRGRNEWEGPEERVRWMARMTNLGSEREKEWERKQGRAAGRRGDGPLVNTTGRLTG